MGVRRSTPEAGKKLGRSGERVSEKGEGDSWARTHDDNDVDGIDDVAQQG